MSRVDKALRAWEKREGVSRLSDRFDIARYSAEASGGPRPEEEDRAEAKAKSLRVESPVPTVSNSPFARLESATARSALSSRLTPGLEARLVTGTSGAVPLEQYRRLAAVLHDIQHQQGLKSLMLTSALPAEGKTLTTINLALTLSESYGRRVLIVDADLRWPSVHRVLGLPNDSGLSEALNSNAEPVVLQVSSNLSVLTAGNTNVAPLAGLTSARMTEVVDWCAARFDWVLLDTPPVGLLPDAQLLARLTRAAVFVIAAGVTPAATVERAITELGPECIIGTVLNRVADHRIPQSGYYSRYGYGASEGDEA